MNTLVGRKNAFCAMAQNAFFLLYYRDERFSGGDERVQSALKLLAHTATRVGTSDFQAEPLLKLLLTGTHLRKRAVAALSYSPASTLYPQVIHAIAFSAAKRR